MLQQITAVPNNAEARRAQRKARLIAYYLPQFHPIPENDEWWGKGFTEWTNVAKAKPLFRGHYQPHIPADLGFYDLRVPETRLAQAEMAQKYGIEAFCYWHYWFAGRRLLERPFNEVLRSGEPDFPFCLGWANASWTGVWYGASNKTLVEQTYPGMQDHEAHFYALLPAFTDSRYMTVDGKPVFLLFRPKDLPDAERVMDFWRSLAAREGLAGIHWIANADDVLWSPEKHGFDAATTTALPIMFRTRALSMAARVRRKLTSVPATAALANRSLRRPVHVYDYAEVSSRLIVERPPAFEHYPCVIPNWDNTPRSGRNGSVLHNSTPEAFGRQLDRAIESVTHLPEEHRIIVVKSWNEWAEGNYLEPDQRFGKAYLEVTREKISGKESYAEQR